MSLVKLALLFGGKSGEHEVSVTSAVSIYQALDKNKYDITLIGIDPSGRWTLPSKELIQSHTSNPRAIKLSEIKDTFILKPFALKPQPFDVVFPILHGTNGEDGTIQGLLELNEIAYVGSGVVGSAVSMDKEITKRVLESHAIPVVPYMCVKKIEYLEDSNNWIKKCEEKFGYPFFVKPANMGSSVGVHKVKNAEQALTSFADAFLYDLKVLVEKAVDARELEVAILGTRPLKASIIGEIIPNHEFYSYEAKYLDQTGADLKIPAENLSQAQATLIQDIAKKVFSALECLGLARIDFFIDKLSQEIFVNEVNTLPGFTSISMYPKLMQASGVPYSKLLDTLIDLALEHKQKRLSLKTQF